MITIGSLIEPSAKVISPKPFAAFTKVSVFKTSLNSLTPAIASAKLPTNFAMTGTRPSPISIITTLSMFLNLCICCTSVPNLFSASVFNADCLSISSAAKPRLLLNSSVSEDKESITLDTRTEPKPTSCNTLVTSPPDEPILSNPSTNATAASDISSCASFLNSSPVIPTAEAKASSFAPPCDAACCKAKKNFCKAVAPAWASVPVALTDAEKASVSSAVNPAILPTAPNRVASKVISDSVAAVLLPNLTNTFANWSAFSAPIPVTFASLATEKAACSAVIFVATPNLATVSINCGMFCTSTPN